MEITLPAPVGTVWTAFRDPAVIRRWFGWDYDDLDDEIRVVFSDETVADEAARTLQVGGHVLSLQDEGPETVVRVVRTPGAASDACTDEIEEGWLSFLQQLRFVLARQPDGTRRTLYLGGETVGEPPAPAVDLLGLGSVGSGGRYRATTSVGDVLTGEVWFRSDRQLGLSVDGWGPGWLLVAQSPTLRPPHGAAALALWTYGLDPAVATDLESRWSAWWATSYSAGAPTSNVPPVRQ